MAIRVLILNRQLAFAVKIKQALEQTGLFDVHPFTKADAAFDFLREHPQDVALVDFTLPGRSGAKVIQQLRSIQADLAVVISPRQPDADVAELNLQGMIDAPFNARDVIPLLERAVEPGGSVIPPETRQANRFVEETDVDQSQLTTGDLESEPPVRDQFGVTRRLDNEPDEEIEAPAQTRNFDDAGSPSYSPAQTRQFDDPDSPSFSPAQTRQFDDPDSPSYSPPQTRQFDDPESPSYSPAQTRDLSEEDELPRLGGQTRLFPEDMPDSPDDEVASPQEYGKTRQLGDDMSLPPQHFATRQFDDSPPPAPPEMSSLDEVLKSFGFEPPIEEQDTPPVPTKDSDALRQYLATSERPEGGDTFDDVLGAIDPDTIESKTQTDEFRGLVRSLQGSEPHTPLPGRQQQTMDFILTSGMDSVLREIEKTKTGPLTPPPSLPEESSPQSDTFQQLAEDEPPMPTLEESGTVSDLLLGISDRGFRNVLSLLRGDEVEEGESSHDMDEAFHDFYASDADGQGRHKELGDLAPRRTIPLPPELPSSSSEFDFDNLPDEPPLDDEASVAQVVLHATLDESQLPKGFSVDKLMADIEDRLAAHKLNVRPLPSWDMDTTAFRAIIDQAEIREPSFLPEELPPGEFVPQEEQATRTSPAVHKWLEDYATEPEPGNLEDTIPSEPVRLSEKLQEWPDEAPESLPDNLLSSVEADDEPVSAPEFPADFGTEHMFDDMFPSVEFAESAAPPVEPGWVDDDDKFPVEPVGKSALDELFAPREVEPDAPVLPVEPTWIEENIQPLPRATSEVPAVVPSWVDTGDEGWDVPPDVEPVAEDELDDSPQFDFEPSPVVSPALFDDMAELEREASVEEFEDVPELEAEASVEEFEDVSELEAEVSVEEFEEAAVEADDWSLSEENMPDEAIPESDMLLSPEEAYIAQLALNLTQVSLELSSEGSILTRKSDIVAFAGHLSQEDALELRDVIHNDWEVGSEGARLRFINLPSSGKDYMLYSIRTVNDLVLSMIFAGTTPLRVIRQQGQRLIEALESAPETPVEAAASSLRLAAITPVKSAPPVVLDDYAYVWLLRDPDQHLSDAVGHAISTGLTVQLNEMSWKIQSLQVDENYVYLLAGVPGEVPPYQVINDLQRRSAEIASTQDQSLTPQNLWADSYLVLTPGREMSQEEIQEFIDFQRMM